MRCSTSSRAKPPTLLDCERASIFLLDRERNELWSKVALGSDEILRFDARLGIAGTPSLTGQHHQRQGCLQRPALLRRHRRPDRLPHAQPGGGAGPQPEGRDRRRLRGAEQASRARSPPRDEEALVALASHAATAIETAQLVGELRRNQDELVRAERASVA